MDASWFSFLWQLIHTLFMTTYSVRPPLTITRFACGVLWGYVSHCVDCVKFVDRCITGRQCNFNGLVKFHTCLIGVTLLSSQVSVQNWGCITCRIGVLIIHRGGAQVLRPLWLLKAPDWLFSVWLKEARAAYQGESKHLAVTFQLWTSQKHDMPVR